MKELKKDLRIRPVLLEQEVQSYASDEISLPEGGIDCNEGCNPYGFPECLYDAMKNFDIKRFGPYPHSHAINDNLTKYWKGTPFVEQENMLLADGSINALYTVFGIFNTPGAVVLGVAPQFTDAEMTVKLLGMEYRPVRLRKENNYRFDVDEFISQITEDVNVIYIDNPNNPTGQVIQIEDIVQVIDCAVELGIAVIIDEAYGDFMPDDNSAMQILPDYPNLIMIRTMSKAFGLAGLRVGYVVAHKNLISCMKKTVNPYQVSEFAREMAGAALSCPEHILKSVEDFAIMKREIKDVLSVPGHLTLAETCDTVSIFLLQYDDPTVNLQKLFWENKVLCVSGYSFDGLGIDTARIRLPIMDEFPILLEAIKTIHNA